jgi:hypothetical protein
MNSHSLARKFCGESLSSLGDWNLKKQQKYYERKRLEKISMKGIIFSDRIQDLVLRQMKNCSIFRAKRSILGKLYILIFYPLQNSYVFIFFLLFPVFISALFAYIPSAGYIFLYITPIFWAAQLDLIPHRHLLLSIGREEHFRGALVLTIVFTLLATLVVLLIALLTILISWIVPEFTYNGFTVTFHSISLRTVYLIVIVVPLGLTFGTFLKDKFLPIAIAMLFILTGTLVLVFRPSLLTLIPVNTLSKVTFTTIAWVVCGILFYYYCHRKDLVSQRG